MSWAEGTRDEHHFEDETTLRFDAPSRATVEVPPEELDLEDALACLEVGDQRQLYTPEPGDAD